MKKTLIAILALGGLAMGETYTWTNETGNNKWGTAGNWMVGSTGQAATAIPEYTNNNADTYIIGDGYTVDVTNRSVGNLEAILIVGDNVSLGGNWAFIFQSVTIGSNFTSTFTGDGIKWTTSMNATDSSSVANSLTLNCAYEYGNDRILSTIGAGSTIHLGIDGKITTKGGNIAQGKKLVLTADVTLNQGHEKSTLVDRVLIAGNNIWYRDVTNENGVLDMDALTLTSIDGDTMKKYDFVKDTNASWTIDGTEAATTAGAYRFYATMDGIGVQYYTVAVPEPTTATLSLLALAGLAARRRRK